jgi:F0F1-type ATP synthase delta subunit
VTQYTYDIILEDIRTVEDLQLLHSELDVLMVALFQSTGDRFKTTLNSGIQRNLGNVIMQSLTEQHITLDDHEHLQAYFQGLKTFITSLPVLQLKLAFHPSNQQLLQLSDWIRSSTGKPVMLQLQFNKQLLGGAVVTYEGKYTDLTLQKKLENVYTQKRAEILGLLK